MIQILTNQHQLSFRFTFPLIILNRETLTAEVEDVTIGTLIKPDNSLSTEYILRQVMV
jgi:hypothetical protein